ncbi:MAG TPA: hypothetical protein VF868_04980 [Bacteroidia bacterium]|jgi:hypothetical protein
MGTISTSSELKAAIQSLSIRQAEESALLKIQFRTTCDHLRPVNLIKSAFRDLTSSPELKGGIASNLLSIGSGFLVKQVISGGSFNPLKLILGSLVQKGVTNLVSKNSDDIGSFLSGLINKFTSKKP